MMLNHVFLYSADSFRAKRKLYVKITPSGNSDLESTMHLILLTMPIVQSRKR